MNDYNCNSNRSSTLRHWCILAAVLFTSCGQHGESDDAESTDQVANGGESDTPLDVDLEGDPITTPIPAESSASSSGSTRPQGATTTGAEAPSVSPEAPPSVQPDTTSSAQPGTEPSTPPSAAPTNAQPPATPSQEPPRTPSTSSAPSATTPSATTPSATTSATSIEDPSPSPSDPAPAGSPADLPRAVCSTDIGAFADGSSFSINTETNQYDRHILEMRHGDMLRRITTYVTTGDAGHQHSITLSDEDLVTLLDGGIVPATTDPPLDTASEHTHRLLIAACNSATERESF